MGTRSTTKIYRDGKLVLALYKQYDGYPEGWGRDLKEFFKSKRFVRGIGDVALQFVCQFKEEIGGLYATTEDDSQQYNYVIDFHTGDPETGKKSKVVILCKEACGFYEEFEVT